VLAQRLKIFVFMLGCSSLSQCRWTTGPTSDTLGGTTIDGGGDTIICSRDLTLKRNLESRGRHYFEGEFALDYFLTFNAQDESHYIGEPSWDHEKYLDTVAVSLSEKSESLGRLMQNFVAHIAQEDESKPYVWQATSLSLSDLADEAIDQTMPKNCRRLIDSGPEQAVPDLRQAIRRKQLEWDPNKRFFLYDAQRVQGLKEKPLQYSFLMVHEFLWDVSDSAWAKRTFNKLLHSKRFATMSRQDFATTLESFGLMLTPSGRLIRSVDSDSAIAQIFSDPDVCEWSERVTQEFHPEEQYITIDPGHTKMLSLDLQDPNGILGHQLCGLALMIPYRHTEAASLPVEIQLSFAEGPMSIPAQASVSKFFAHAVCDIGCINMQGSPRQMADTLFARSSFKRKWQITVINPTGNQRLILNRPYMTFVKMKPLF
jgi:hypothetical protein